MFRQLLRAKIHRVTVTDSNLAYEGSLTVDEELMQEAGIGCYELVMVSNLNNGERFETYIIPGPPRSGMITLNGPAARKGIVGDQLVVFCYSLFTEEEVAHHRPTIVLVDEHNRVVSRTQGDFEPNGGTMMVSTDNTRA